MGLSDVLVIKKDGTLTSHYMNGRSYRELLSFVGIEKCEKKSVTDEKLTPEPVAQIIVETENVPVIQVETKNENGNGEKNGRKSFTPSEVSIFADSAEIAAECGRMHDYEESRAVDKMCSEEIQRVIRQSKKSANEYDLQTALAQLSQTYGKSRLVWVIGLHIIQNPAGFSSASLTWAENVLAIPGYDENGNLLLPNEPPHFKISMHYALLEAFIKRLDGVCIEKPVMIRGINLQNAM
jgi:Ni,Fe-hydrogenase maturation factor